MLTVGPLLMDYTKIVAGCAFERGVQYPPMLVLPGVQNPCKNSGPHATPPVRSIKDRPRALMVVTDPLGCMSKVLGLSFVGSQLLRAYSHAQN